MILIPIALSAKTTLSTTAKYPILAILSTFAIIAYYKSDRPIIRAKTTLALFGFIATIAIQAVFNYNPMFTPEVLSYIVPAIIFYFATTKLERSEIIRLFGTISIMGLNLSIFAIIQEHAIEASKSIASFTSEGGRIVSFLGHKNDLVMALNATMPLTILVIILKKSGIRRAFHLMSLLAQAYTISIAGSRAGIVISSSIAVILGLYAMSFISAKNIAMKATIYFLVTILVSIALYPIIDIPQKAITQTTWSDNVRIDSWRMAMSMFKSKPIGYGPGGFEKYHPKFKPASLAREGSFQHYPAPMSTPLLILVDYGVIGALFAITFTLLLLIYAFTRINKRYDIAISGPELFLPGISLASLIAHSFIDLCLTHPYQILLLAIISGAITRLTGNKRQESAMPVYTQCIVVTISLILSIYAVILLKENIQAMSRTEMKHPITVLGKYSTFNIQVSNSRESPELLKSILHHAPGYRYIDYLAAVYLATHGQPGAARVALAQYETIHPIKPYMADFKTWLEAK